MVLKNLTCNYEENIIPFRLMPRRCVHPLLWMYFITSSRNIHNYTNTHTNTNIYTNTYTYAYTYPLTDYNHK